jgi:hypothetical protein
VAAQPFVVKRRVAAAMSAARVSCDRWVRRGERYDRLAPEELVFVLLVFVGWVAAARGVTKHRLVRICIHYKSVQINL